MFQRLNHRLGHYSLLLAVGASLFLINLGGPALWDIDEGRNATAFWEMLVSGDWVKPTFNGDLRSHKPALLYWLQVAASQLCGVNELAARLPSALAAMLTLLLIYELGRRMFNPATGLLAGVILASSTLFCASAHFANPDALLLTFTTATLLFYWLGFDSGRTGWFAAVGAASGLAVLAKGPVGLVLPVAITGLHLLLTRRWHLLFNRMWIVASLLFGVVALPWYVLVAIETKREFLTEFIFQHNVARALSPMEDHSGPPWYYLVVLIVGLVPWSAFLGSTLWCAAAESRGKSQKADGYRFLWCWIGLFLLCFTIAATKLPNYILPVFPPFALLIAAFLDRWQRGVVEIPRWVQPLSLSMVALAGAVTIVSLLIVGGAIETGLLQGRSWPGLELWAPLGLILLAGAALGGWCLLRQRRTAFVAVMVTAAVGFLAPLAAGGSAALNNFRAPRPLVEQAGALQPDHEIRVGCFQLEFLPSLNFYVQRNVQHHQDAEAAMNFLRQELTVFLFLPRSEWEKLAPLVQTPHRVVAAHREMYRAGEVVVVTNR